MKQALNVTILWVLTRAIIHTSPIVDTPLEDKHISVNHNIYLYSIFI